jgi:hypothetical protein
MYSSTYAIRTIYHTNTHPLTSESTVTDPFLNDINQWRCNGWREGRAVDQFAEVKARIGCLSRVHGVLCAASNFVVN